MKEIIDIIANFSNDRPILKNHNANPVDLIHMVMAEVNEAEEVIFDRDKLATELPDIIWFVVQLALNYDIDIEKEIRTKAAFNLCRFPAEEFKEGDYYVQRTKCKRELEPEVKRDWTSL